MRTKILIFLLLATAPFIGRTQNWQYGVELSPSFDFQLQIGANQTWSTVRGNGYLAGFFADRQMNEHTFIGTGLKLEYISFNEKAEGILLNSFRIASLNIPLTFKQEIGITKHWFYSAGIGLNYNFLNRQLVFGQWISLKDIAQEFQPYLNVGINYLMDNHFEIGTHARYHVLDLWDKDHQNATQTSTHLFSFDFSLRYTIGSF